MEITTERLILRDFKLTDVVDVHSYASDPINVKYMSYGPNDEADSMRFISESVEQIEKTPRLNFSFAIVLRRNGKLIGACNLNLNKEMYEGMVGWILHKDYWKQGYMTEAAKELINFGFTELNLHRIYGTCFAENYGSYRVMENCGMRREGFLIKSRRMNQPPHEWADEYYYAILEDEWKEK